MLGEQFNGTISQALVVADCAGLSQEALAEKANIAPRYLQMLEAGSFGCSLAALIRLRRALNVSWATLLKNLK